MTACPGREALEEVALGGGTAEARAHAAACPRCASRTGWLRREEEIVRRWAAQDDAPTAHLWEGVQRRLRASRRRRFLGAAGCAAVLAAAAVLVARQPREQEPESTASAVAAIDQAEAEYRRAIDVLEAQVSARSESASPREAALVRARTGLARARAASGREPAGRVRVQEGYAAYLRSLRRALRERP